MGAALESFALRYLLIGVGLDVVLALRMHYVWRRWPTGCEHFACLILWPRILYRVYREYRRARH